ncbi:hypothetical protein [Nocardiopsis sp. NRRL B-16309]|uniref:hypothetical protein n=1 Tax=Nocardiopsis sp. NRRL B-16309 TaxID=1519494 RepID=UPI000A9E3FB3|nr:hypothetical protein [Nocardiopsis sp. NRRL B-16309]
MDYGIEPARSEEADPGRELRDALAAADLKRLVRASREDNGDEVERIRRRYVDG